MKSVKEKPIEVKLISVAFSASNYSEINEYV